MRVQLSTRDGCVLRSKSNSKVREHVYDKIHIFSVNMHVAIRFLFSFYSSSKSVTMMLMM